MNRKNIVVRVSVDKRAARVILAAAALCALSLRLSSETLTLSTTYPAPVGAYSQVVTRTLRLSGQTTDPAAPAAGTVYYNSASRTFRGYADAWQDFGQAQGAWCGYRSTPGLGPVVDVACRGTSLAAGVCPAGFTFVSLGVGTTCLKN